MFPIIQDSLPHTATVVVHVLLGIAALVVGAVQLLRQKGDMAHVRRGRIFLICVWVSLGTAAAGLVLFQFRTFLAALTLSVGYWAYSGVRALQIRVTGPEIRDALASVAALGASLALYQHANQFPSVPFVIYWTLGILVVGSLYDLARFGFPRHWFATLWLYEHLVKILAAYAGVVQASTGMLFGSGQPYGRSQLIAAVLGIGVIVSYLIYFRTMRAAAMLRSRSGMNRS